MRNAEESLVKEFLPDESLETSIPIVADLDGTLINTDLLHESVILLLKKNPLFIFLFPVWLLKGKVYFKTKLHQFVQINFPLLPYNKPLLDFLHKESAGGRQVILATASLQANATEIAKVFPIFSLTHGTENLNLKGKNKLDVLLKLYGKAGFDYVGNSYSDLSIFEASRYSFLVSADKILEKRAKKVSNLQYIWKSRKNTFKDYLKAIRAYQWIKNILIFVPLVTSHSFNIGDFITTLEGFFAFNLVASSGYLLNDLLDLDSDRAHARKRFRPVASGNLSIPVACILAICVFSAGMFLAAILNIQFLLMLASYFLLTLAYSLYMKKIALCDIFVLALLYSVRVIAGAILIGVSLSSWLVAFSTFLFLSLAFVKRYAELHRVADSAETTNKAREYSVSDLTLLQTMGIAAGFLSVIVFSLYLDSAEVALLYSRPKLMWIISFLFLFWISRVWLKAAHGEMTDDPIIYAVKDKTSYLLFLIIGVILFFSI